jgi:hypothetical protein
MVSTRRPQLLIAFVRSFRPTRCAITRECLSGEDAARRLVAARWLVGLAILVAMVARSNGARAQDQKKRKIPVVDKITGGNSHQAFSGKVQAVDLKRHVLEVNHAEGTGMEIFPLKSGVPVTSAAGAKLKLDQLKEGTDVIIYYDVKDDRRSIKEIVVLAPGSTENHKKASPPS